MKMFDEVINSNTSPSYNYEFKNELFFLILYIQFKRSKFNKESIPFCFSQKSDEAEGTPFRSQIVVTFEG